MEITLVPQNEKTLEIQLNGRLDTYSAPVFSTKMEKIPQGVTTIILELSGLRYISSAGLRALLHLKKELEAVDGDLIVRNADQQILEVFSVTGFDSLLIIQ